MAVSDILRFINEEDSYCAKLTSSPSFTKGIPTAFKQKLLDSLRRVPASSILPRGFKLGFRRKYPAMGIFTTMSQLISPGSHIISTGFTFGLSGHSPIKEGE